MSKSNLLFIIFIMVAYGVWKALDYFALPNTFTILLILLTALCGILWCFHRFVVLPKRARQVLRTEQRTGKTLTEDEKRQIEPISEGAEMLSSLFPVLAFVLILRSFVWEPFQIPSGSMEPTLRVGDFLLVDKYAYGIKDPVFQNTIIETGKPQRGDIVVFKAPCSAEMGICPPKPVNGAEKEAVPFSPVDYIKRVIAVGGDRIIYDFANKKLAIVQGVNGQPCTEECKVLQYAYSTPEKNDDFVVVYQNYAGERIDVPAYTLTEKSPELTHQINWGSVPDQSEPQLKEWLVPEGEYFVMGDNRDNSHDSRYWNNGMGDFVPEKNILGRASYIWLSLDREQGKWPTGIRFERMFSKIK